MLATVGVVCLVASVAVALVQSTRADAPTIVSSTAHFIPNRTYLLMPANGGSSITCKVLKIDGAWLKCEGDTHEWVNIDTIMFAEDK
jgi:hypothetical protein